MDIDLIFSGSAGSRAVPVTRTAFDVMVSGAAAVPSAFGGKAHTCYSLDIALSYSKGPGGFTESEPKVTFVFKGQGCVSSWERGATVQCDASLPAQV
jgi:hypothetical protein